MSAIHKDEYRRAAENRLVDAKVLKDANRHHAMIYLLGFVLECALAYSYCARNQKQYIQDVKGYNDRVWKNHNQLLDKLMAVGLHSLSEDLSKIAKEWKVEMRYAGDHYTSQVDKQRAEKLFDLTRSLFVRIKANSL